MFWYFSSWVVVIVWHTVYLHRDQPPAAVSSAGPEYKKLCLLELGWAQLSGARAAGGQGHAAAGPHILLVKRCLPSDVSTPRHAITPHSPAIINNAHRFNRSI